MQNDDLTHAVEAAIKITGTATADEKDDVRAHFVASVCREFTGNVVISPKFQVKFRAPFKKMRNRVIRFLNFKIVMLMVGSSPEFRKKPH